MPIKNEVIKHSAAVQMSHRMTLVQHKAWNVLLNNAYYDFHKKDIFEILVDEVKEGIEYTSRDNLYLQEQLEGLGDIKVKWNLFGKDKKNEWGFMSLLAGAKIKNGILRYGYSPFLREMLQDPAMYIRLSLLLQNQFSAEDSLALFELLIDYFDVKRGCGETPWKDLATIREFFGIEEHEYREFKHLNASVIKKAIKEVAKISGMLVWSEFKRRKRKVAEIKFHMKKNPNQKSVLDVVQDENGVYDVTDELNKIGKTMPPLKPQPPKPYSKDLSAILQLMPEKHRNYKTGNEYINIALKKFDYGYVEANIIYTAKHSNRGFCGYMKKALANNYAGYKAQLKPKSKPAPIQSSPKPKPEKWPIVGYRGQIVDLSIFQNNGEHNTVVAFDEGTNILTALHLHKMYKKRDSKVKVLKKMPNSMPQPEKLPTVTYNGYTVNLEEHRYIIGNGLIVVGKDVKGRDLNYASLLRLYRQGEVEVVDEHKDSCAEKSDEVALV